MDKLTRYIYKNFSSIFFSFFLPLFSIASLIFFIKIVSITSIIKIDFFELLKLYLYVLPQILFYTIPIVFFASSVITLTKLSNDYEMIVLFSLGVKPIKIAHIFGKIALLSTVSLLLISLITIPQAKQTYKNFIIFKKTKAIFNIKPSEFGQKFGDWMLFIEKEKDKNVFENIVLYNYKLLNKENFILAKEAKIVSDNKGLKFILVDGVGYTYEKDRLNEIKFDKMVINDLSVIEGKVFRNPIEYWLESVTNKTRAFDFTIFIIISIFPIISIFLIMALGIINPRFAKNKTFLSIFISITIFYVISFVLSKQLPFYAVFIVGTIWFFIGYFLYKKRIGKRF